MRLNLCSDTDVAEVKHPDGLILAIRLPQATRYQRPEFLGQHGLNPELEARYRANRLGSSSSSTSEEGFIKDALKNNFSAI